MGPPVSRHVPPAESGPSRLASIRWGLLAVVASAHAAGLFALYGLDGPALSASQPATPPAIAVRLIAPELDVPTQPSPPLASPPEQPIAATRSEDARRSAASPPRTTSRPRPAAPKPAVSAGESPPARPAADEVPAPAPPAPVPHLPSPLPGGAPAERTPPPVAVAPKESPPTVAASFDAAYLHNPAPAYPNGSRRRGEQGRVVLRVQVHADGSAGAVDVAESSGHERLDAAARETVRGWRFAPARRGDSPVDSWLRVPVVFRLDDD